MKKILFNLCSAQPSVDSKFHGGGEYSKAVFEYLADNYHNNTIKLSVFYNPELFLDEWIINKLHEKNIETLKVKNELLFYKEIDCSKFDTFYTGMTFEFDRSLLPSNIKTIGTIHDLRNYEEVVDKTSYLYYDSLFDKIKQIGKLVFIKKLKKRNLNQYRKRVNSFDSIVCVSEHTYYMMKAHLPEFKNKIKGITYTPTKHYEKSKKPDGFNLSEYLLIVSANRWLKNSYSAIQAIDDLYNKKLLDKQTVLVGGISKTIWKRIHNKNQFVILNYLEAEELEYIYEHCLLFIYPTFNEGFGMPPLEAMRYGKTSIVSGLCSLPELYYGVSYIVNPYSKDEIEGRILNAIDKPISVTKIKQRFQYIVDRQNEDIKKLCNIIMQ